MKKVMWEQIPDRRSIASFLKRRKGMCILILLYLLCLVFVKNDAWLYRTPIVKITDVREKENVYDLIIVDSTDPKRSRPGTDSYGNPAEWERKGNGGRPEE